MSDRRIEYVPGQIPVAGQPTLEDFLRREFQKISEVLGDGGKFLNQSEAMSIARHRNLIINGNFDIWQRGASHSTSGYGSADRWRSQFIGSSQVTSRQDFALGQTDVPGEPRHYLRCVVNSVAGTANYAQLLQHIESVRTAAGQQVVVSFYAKADANKNLSVGLLQYFGSDGSATTIAQRPHKVQLTTQWQRFELSFYLPSLAGKSIVTTTRADFLQLEFWMDSGSIFDSRSAALGHQSGTFDFAQVQLEIGRRATPFEQRSVGEELALCQRFYQVGGVTLYSYVNAAGVYCFETVGLPVSVRTSPILTGTWTYFGNAQNGVLAPMTYSQIRAQCVSTGAGILNAGVWFMVDAEL